MTKSTKLYKFRPLANDLDFYRLKEILETGKFWCSRFHELNDPMEGAFTSYLVVDNAAEDKNKWLICSFSDKEALKDPRMWGYYANSFKGVAIEIEIEEEKIGKEIYEIAYTDEIPEVPSREPSKKKIKEILGTKLKAWEHEKEYRFLLKKPLDQGEDQHQKIGEITRIYLGNPYGWASNSGEIEGIDRKLIEYKKRAEKIESLAKNKDIAYVWLNGSFLKNNYAWTK